MNEPSKGFYEFGPFCLDAGNRLLLREGKPVPLKPKVFDTLLVLVEERGRVLTKEELMSKIWPDTAVEENNLTQNISVLRKVLGQSPGGNQYIETMPRRGYRFVPPDDEVWEDDTRLVVEKHTRSRIVIEETQQETPQQEDRAENTAQVTDLNAVPGASIPLPSRRMASRIFIGLALLLTGVFLLTIGRLFLSRPEAQFNTDLISSLRMVQVASWTSPTRPAGTRIGGFSPDGKMVVYSSNKGGRKSIWIKQVSSGDPNQIINDDWNNESPLWSPDGEMIAFVSNRGDQYGIWAIPKLGGSPTLLKNIDAGWPQLSYWSKDGFTIYYAMNFNLFALNINSGEITKITDFDPSRHLPLDFSISPEEDRFAYADGKPGHLDIWVRPMQGGEPVRVTDDPENDRRPVWCPDGKCIIHNSDRAGTNQIRIAYMDGSSPAQITFGDTELSVLDVSPDGTRILCLASKEEAAVVGLNIQTREESELTSNQGLELWPDISADGKAIAFQATNSKDRILSSSILVKPREPDARYIQLAADGFDPRWSPDGSKIGFLRQSNGILNIWTVRSTGGGEKQVTTEGISFDGFTALPYNRMQTKYFSWSPDSSRIVYCSFKSGQSNLWVASVDGSGEYQVSSNADPNLTFLCPLWSPEGGRIAHVSVASAPSADRRIIESLWVTENERSRIVFQTESILHLIGWSSSGNKVLVALVESGMNSRPKAMQITLAEISIDSGKSRNITKIVSPYFTNIQLSPDGLNIAFVSRQDGKDNIWIVPTDGQAGRKVTENADSAIYISSLAWSPDGKEIYYSKQQGWSIVSTVDNFRSR